MIFEFLHVAVVSLAETTYVQTRLVFGSGVIEMAAEPRGFAIHAYDRWGGVSRGSRGSHT